METTTNVDRDTILANLNLKAVLPLVEDVVRLDICAKEIARGWNCSIMMKLMGTSDATTLVFKNGVCEAVAGSAGIPSFGMWFSSPEKLNRSFNGENIIPLVWITKFSLVNAFKELTGRLEYYMKPTDEVLKDKAKFAAMVELTIYAAARGAAVVATLDEEANNYALAAPDGTVLISVVNGPSAHIIKKGGSITAGKGTPPGGADAFMEFKDFDIAYGVLNGTLDAMAAIGTRDVVLRGCVPLVDGLNVALSKLGKYFE